MSLYTIDLRFDGYDSMGTEVARTYDGAVEYAKSWVRGRHEGCELDLMVREADNGLTYVENANRRIDYAVIGEATPVEERQ